jgi:hypothetical protein
MLRPIDSASTDLKIIGNVRIERINTKFFVDYEVEGGWKNYAVCKSRNESLKIAALLRQHTVNWST